MMLTDKQIREFQELYKEQFGVDISRDEAAELGLSLLYLVRSVYKPIKKNEYEETTKIHPSST